MGVITTIAGEVSPGQLWPGFKNGLAAEALLRYALTLDEFHMANIGIDSMQVLNANLETLKNFSPMEEEEMKEIRLALEPFYRGHKLAWMHPSYQDGWTGQIRLA